jgi:hypothetical protein
LKSRIVCRKSGPSEYLRACEFLARFFFRMAL